MENNFLHLLHPYFLFLLPICIGGIIYTSRRYIADSFDRIFFSCLRIVVVTLLILSLAGVSINRFSNRTTTIAAVDISASMDGTEKTVIDYLKAAERAMTPQDGVGVVCFGQEAAVEQSVGEKFPSDISSYVSDSFTNVEEGLKLSQSLMPEDTRKRILLISDGGENLGDGAEQATRLRDKGIRLDVLPVKSVISSEVQLTEIKAPRFVKKGLKYDVVVTGHSLGDAPVRLTVYRNNRLISDTDIHFRNGENKFVISDNSDISGGVIYRAEILSEKDTFQENNTVYGYSYIQGEPNVLVLEESDSAREIIKILGERDIAVTTLKATAAPGSLEALNIYDTVVMPDVPIDSLPEGFPEILEAYVKIGGGLVVTGGENSYALGGYYDTTLEQILPVDMDVKDKEKNPSLGMVVSLDRSGSMSDGRYGVSKLELAKEAVVRAIEVLNDGDFFGVIAFDDGFQWASDYQKISGNKQSMTNNVLNISLGGGTSILPGLREAYEVLKNSDVKQKHIILLTDGQAEQDGYDGILEGMREYGITLSTVAVGAGSDTKLLEYLAEHGNGRYYYTDEFTDLPKIFARETVLAGKDYLNNEKFFPLAGDASQVLSGIEALPPLYGYVSTIGKPRADVSLVSPKDEPILATWQYGLGRAVCFTSDMKGLWSKDWLESQEGTAVFRNMVSWSLRRQAEGDISVTARATGKTAEIRVSIPYAEGVGSISGEIIAENMTRHPIEFSSSAPGEFIGEMDTSEAGAYIADLNIQRMSGEQNYVTGLSIPYSEEFDLRKFSSGDEFLKRLADITGGTFITQPEQIFEQLTDKVFYENDINNLLLTLALLIFLIDVAARRFPVLSAKLKGALSKLKGIRILVPSNKTHSKAVETPKPVKAVPEPSAETKSTVSTSSKLISSKKKRSGR